MNQHVAIPSWGTAATAVILTMLLPGCESIGGGEPRASSPSVQEEKVASADSGGVQERAVVRDHRTQTTTQTSTSTGAVVRDHRTGGVIPLPTNPPVIQPMPSAPATGSTGPLPVVGGVVEPDFRYPWVVRVGGCGGVLIDPQWVLTAAHCVTQGLGVNSVSYSRTDPYTGALQTETHPLVREQRPNPGVYINPGYNPQMDQANDIALVKLQQPFWMSPYIQTVGLPRAPRQQGVVGSLANYSHSTTLPPGQVAVFRAPIPPVDYGPKFYITAAAASASLCPGDSGSGFVTVENGRATVRGLASQANTSNCLTPNGEAVFTDVFTFHDWILQTIGKDDNSLVGNTRVRWSGQAARGVMSVECSAAGTRQGPLNVVGVEEGAVCYTGQTQTLTCSVDPDQGSTGPVKLNGATMRTIMADGTSDMRNLGASSNNVRYHYTLPPGAVSREFTCLVGSPNTSPLLGGNTGIVTAPVLIRGVEGEQGAGQGVGAGGAPAPETVPAQEPMPEQPTKTTPR